MAARVRAGRTHHADFELIRGRPSRCAACRGQREETPTAGRERMGSLGPSQHWSRRLGQARLPHRRPGAPRSRSLARSPPVAPNAAVILQRASRRVSRLAVFVDGRIGMGIPITRRCPSGTGTIGNPNWWNPQRDAETNATPEATSFDGDQNREHTPATDVFNIIASEVERLYIHEHEGQLGRDRRTRQNC